MMVNNISGFELGVATGRTVTTEHKKILNVPNYSEKSDILSSFLTILNVPNYSEKSDILSSFLTFRAGVAILTISIVAVVAIRVAVNMGVML